MRRKIRQLAVAGLVCGALCAAGCGKREDARVPAAREDTTTQRMETTKPAAGAAHVTDEKAGIGAELARLDTAMHAGEILMGLISREDTNGLDLASVSNAVAGIDSETIIRFCREHLERKIYDNPRTIAIAQLYEVVLARSDKPSARMVALIELHQMYGGINAGRVPYEWFKEKEQLYKDARLSANPTEAERTAFATIQVSILTGIDDPEEELQHMTRMRDMCKRGEMGLSQQVLDMMERGEVRALLELKRADEAYAVMKESFAKRDRGTLDPSVWPREYYEDFETSFCSFSNSYYGDPTGTLMREMKESKGAKPR